MAGWCHSACMETTASHISIRLANETDNASILRLAALDSAPAPRGEVLVADLCGEIVAAHSVARSRTIADPFRPTADVTELLELRARQAAGASPLTTTPRRRRLPAFAAGDGRRLSLSAVAAACAAARS